MTVLWSVDIPVTLGGFEPQSFCMQSITRSFYLQLFLSITQSESGY